MHFSISDSDKNSWQQLKDDSQGTIHSSHVSSVPPINTRISHISAEFVTETLCDSKSKENTDISQLFDNSTIPSIQANTLFFYKNQ